MKSVVPRIFLPIAVKIGTPAFQRRVVEMIPSESIRGMKDISDILHARSVQIFNEKKAALARGDDAVKHQVGEGRDIMSILREWLLGRYYGSTYMLTDWYVAQSRQTC